jgi:ADP-ribose pyrophosphatase
MAGRIAGRFVRGKAAFHKPLARDAKPIGYSDLMPKTSTKNKARVISSREVYRGPAFWVTRDQIREPSGIEVRRDIVRHTGSVVILAVDESGREPHVLLVRQYRHAAQQYLWELCAGRIDEGENALVAAKRELREETGYTAKRWRRVLHFYVSPGFVAETMSIYLAEELRPGLAQPEEDEVIEIKLFPLRTALQMVTNGIIRDAKTMTGILWLHQQLNLGKKIRKSSLR